jgi:hypothetical protein
MTSPIRPGDHVVFRGLPASMKPTPLLVTNARDGQIELKNHGGWYKAALFEKVSSPLQTSTVTVGRDPE